MPPLDDTTGLLAPVAPKPETPGIDLSIFDRAADEIKRRGWAQCLIDVSGRVCLLGAIGLALGYELRSRVGGAGTQDKFFGDPVLSDVALQLGFSRPIEIADWNDQQSSPAPVLDRLRRAARGEFV